MSNISSLETKRESIGVGSVVTLKTGGPSMVVMERSAEKAHCIWHLDNGDSVNQWIPIACLEVKK